MEVTEKALVSLLKFSTQQKLQEAVITFIVGQLAQKEDMIDLQRAFKVLDTNNDGTLSKAKLSVGYKKVFKEDISEQVIDKIFKNVDIDGSGSIDYSEWVVATIDKKKLLTNEKLDAAFTLFDKDDGGSISALEVKDVLFSGQNLSDEVWNRVIEEVDCDGNGEIDRSEFKKMMEKMLFDDDELQEEEDGLNDSEY